LDNRTFKKLLLRSQLLEIEEQEFKELDEKYSVEFSRDFYEERGFLSVKKASPEKEKEESFKVPARVLKKLHRKLAMNTHPDVSDDSSAFIEVQAAYELGDAGKLLTLANEMDIEVKLTEKEMIAMFNQLQEKEARLERLRQRVRWVWCTTEQTEILRAQIRKSMGITEEAWKKYKEARSS
jgi:hypothetical protein